MKPDDLAREVRKIVHEVCGTVEDLGRHPHDVTSDEAREIGSSIAGVLRPLIDAPSAEGQGSAGQASGEASAAAEAGATETGEAEQSRAPRSRARSAR